MDDKLKPYILEAPKSANIPAGKGIVYSRFCVIPKFPALLPMQLIYRGFEHLEEENYKLFSSSTFDKYPDLKDFFDHMLSYPEAIEFLIDEVLQNFYGEIDEKSRVNIRYFIKKIGLHHDGILEVQSKQSPSAPNIPTDFEYYRLHVHNTEPNLVAEFYWSIDKSTPLGIGYFEPIEVPDAEGFFYQPYVDEKGDVLGNVITVDAESLLIGEPSTGVHGFVRVTQEELDDFGGDRQALFLFPRINHVEYVAAAVKIAHDRKFEDFMDGLYERSYTMSLGLQFLD